MSGDQFKNLAGRLRSILCDVSQRAWSLLKTRAKGFNATITPWIPTITSLGFILALCGFFLTICILKSNQKSTRAHISKLQEQIATMEKIEMDRKRAGLLTLRKELDMDSVQMGIILNEEAQYVDTGVYRTDFFKTYAYEHGLVTDLLRDEVLINRILNIYHDLEIANIQMQSIIDLNNMHPFIENHEDRRATIKKANKRIVGIIKRHRKDLGEIVRTLIEIEDALRAEQQSQN